MRILFVIDPIERLKAYKDSSVAMMGAFQVRGHRLAWCTPADLRTTPNGLQVIARSLTVIPQPTAQTPQWYQSQEPVDEPIRAFDALIMRKDPPFDMEYVYATHLMDLAQAAGVRVFNSGRALRDHPEKLAIAEFPEFTVPTLVSSRSSDLRAFHQTYRDVVFKPLDGMGGTGVFRLRADEVNVGAIIEMLTQDGTRSIMAQRFIPEIADGDKRVLVIAGQPVPYCLARIPSPGETRGNLAVGGKGLARPLTARDRQIAETVGKALVNRGLILLGLDIIGDYLTEINVTSPTCFREIQDQTGHDVAADFARAVETACGG